MQEAKRDTGSPALRTWLVLLLWWAFVLLPGLAWADEPVGKVIFVSGETFVLRDGQRQTLKTDASVHEGDRLETGEESHVHLRMVDGAFLSLRSESALSITHYRFSPDTPSASRANLTLHEGVVRSISGEIGARSKERFRLDTPVAAIGIRGTDFSVLTSNDLSRLGVRHGGVVMAPLSERCPLVGLGPCEGAGATELFANQKGLLLEATRHAAATRLTRQGQSPDEYRRPHPAEAELGQLDGRSANRSRPQLITGESLPGANSFEEALEQAERYMAQTGLITEAVERGNAASEIQPRDRGAPRSVTWGRWSDHSEGYTNQVAQLIHGSEQNRRLAAIGGTVGNSVFALVETQTPERRLPDTGKAYFDLNRYEAYVKRGSSLEVAAISHPGLVVDFERQRFATRLDVHADSLPGPIPVVGGGNINGAYLESDSRSPSKLAGLLTDGAGEAGLLFEYQIEPGVDAVGATHWVLGQE